MIRKFFLRGLTALACTFCATFMLSADNITDLPVKAIDGRDYYYYEVQPKETVFSITRKFSISPERLMEFNPAVRDGLKAYSTLYFPADVFGEPVSTSAEISTDYRTVTIQKGQSLFGLAREYDTTVDAILAANPGLDSSKYKAGEEIRIPVGEDAGISGIAQGQPVVPERKEETVPVSDDTTPFLAETVPTPDGILGSEGLSLSLGIPDVVPQAEDVDTLSVTLFLPLDLKADNPSKTAQLYIEFYRGFLLGVKERSTYGKPIRINVIDSSVPDEEYARILDSDAVAGTDLFIGPEKESRLIPLAKKAAETGAFVLSPFVIKEDLPQSYPAIVQTNIPRAQMYSGAIGKFKDIYDGFTPVFVSRIEGDADKNSFTEQLKASLREDNVAYKEVNFRGVLIAEDLRNADAGKNMIIIPASGNRNELLKCIDGIAAFRDSLGQAGRETMLFGYPEWITMRGESQKKIRDVGTTIYSRYAGIGGPASESVRRAYMQWYGGDWQDVEPNPALMGYDMANFAIDNLRRGDGDFFPVATDKYEGVQNAFMLGQPFEGSGYINQALYLVRYTPEGIENELICVPVTQELGE